MRLGGIKAMCLLLVFLSFGGLLFADDKTVNLESKIIQTFDDQEKEPWFTIASKFAAKDYPKLAYVNAWPSALFGYSPATGKDLKVLGISMMFDRKEYNWVDLIPGTVDKSGEKPIYKPIELPLPGRVKVLDIWVWGSGFNYYIEAYVRDYLGIVHVIPMGDINFEGWKNLRSNIPTNIPQSKRYLPKKEGISLIKFRIWTRPSEMAAVPIGVNDPQYMRAVNVYIDQVKVLTDTFESLFDGDSLTDPKLLEETWGGSTKTDGK